MGDEMKAPLLEEGGDARIQIQEPETNLQTGLSLSEVKRRQEKYGPNALASSESSLLMQFIKQFIGPMPIMIWIAIIIEAFNQDWLDFGVLFVLQMLNGLVGFIEQKNAGDAIAALKNALAPQAEVKRGGNWSKIDARGLVPGDLIQLKIGDVIPADGILLEGDPIQVDQAALTGESLPVTIWPGSDVKMGSSIKRGETEALVTSIGKDTFLGRAASLVASVESQGRFQAILFRITLGLLFISGVLSTIIFLYLIFATKLAPLKALAICVVLLVASIPIAMQVVCTSTMAVGSRRLARKGAIVARLSAIEELAGMRILCSDKTGTLTKNELVLNDPILFGDLSADDLVFWSALATKRSEGQDRDAIDTIIVNSVADTARLAEYTQTKFVPFNPTDKRTEATVVAPDGQEYRVVKGAPQVVLDMSVNKDEVAEDVEESMVRLADRGYRPVGVAVSNTDGDLIMAGMLSLFDPPRDDTAETIRRALSFGVEVKMITGDHTLIAKETARRLNMGTNIHSVEAMDENTTDFPKLVRDADGFAEVFPEHKFKIVDVLRQQGFITGMTGDGVNDAPALKRADIGVAVEGSTEAARSAADIVLTEPGLMTIIDAIIRSRKIFQRMRNYCIYRLTCSLQLLFFVFISVLLVKPSVYFAGVDAKEAFHLPVTALVLITVLNDGTILTISHDKVVPGQRPQKWALGQVSFVSLCLGLFNTMTSVLFLFAGATSGNGTEPGHFNDIMGTLCTGSACTLTYSELLTTMYMQVSISGFLTVFCARTRSHVFSRRPGYALLTAALVATTTSTILAAFWPFNPSKDPNNMGPIEGKLLGVVWAYAIVCWFLQDMVKLVAYAVIDSFNRSEEEELALATKRKALSTALETERRATRATLDSENLRRRISNAGDMAVSRESSMRTGQLSKNRATSRSSFAME